MPEPILHPFAKPAVLVVGFNPNYGAGEDIPRFGSDEKAYVDFYKDRFAQDRRDDRGRPAHKKLGTGELVCVGHYHVVEQLLAGVLDCSFPFGEQAVYCDAIPWKWKKECRLSVRKVDGEIAYERLNCIIRALEPRVVLTLGADAARAVGSWTKDLPRPLAANNGNWPVWHVASYHADAHGGRFARHRGAVQQALREALAS